MRASAIVQRSGQALEICANGIADGFSCCSPFPLKRDTAAPWSVENGQSSSKLLNPHYGYRPSGREGCLGCKSSYVNARLVGQQVQGASAAARNNMRSDTFTVINEVDFVTSKIFGQRSRTPSHTQPLETITRRLWLDRY